MTASPLDQGDWNPILGVFRFMASNSNIRWISRANHEWSIVQNYHPKKWIFYDCFIPNVTTSVGPSPPLRLMHTQEGSTEHIFNWGLQAGNCHALRLLFSLAIQSNWTQLETADFAQQAMIEFSGFTEKKQRFRRIDVEPTCDLNKCPSICLLNHPTDFSAKANLFRRRL